MANSNRLQPFLPKNDIPGPILPALAEWAVTKGRMFTDQESPFRASLNAADPRLLLIVGENASGKSLAFRMLSQLLALHKVLTITISIRERTGAGTAEMAGMRRMFMFGDEITSSTGATSASVADRAFDELARERPTALGLDEPEIGLSDGYAAALGELIGTRSLTLPDNACGVIVVTHSRPLVRGLIKGLGAEPTIMRMNAPGISASEWLETSETRSIEDLRELQKIALERFRATHQLFSI